MKVLFVVQLVLLKVVGERRFYLFPKNFCDLDPQQVVNRETGHFHPCFPDSRPVSRPVFASKTGSPVTQVMIINSSELRASGFKLKEVIPPVLETAARGDLWTRG